MSMSDYEVLDTLGKGSFGTVSRIKRKRDGKVRAVPLHSCRCFPLLRTFVKVSMHSTSAQFSPSLLELNHII